MSRDCVAEILRRGHETVAVFERPEEGMQAIIAIHNTALGPGLGGCRMRSYQTFEDALDDVLRLSEGMTYKNALAGLPYGGGKSVIVADSQMQQGREELFSYFGACVKSLVGRYITAEDFGTGVEDIEVVRRITEHVAGRSPQSGGGGDPSPYTALGVFFGIKACVERALGHSSFAGARVAIQGVGHVGAQLARLLAKEGAELILADPRDELLQELAQECRAEVVGVDEIYGVNCDVFAPCAIGGVLNPSTIPRLRCTVVAGGANNQLERDEYEEQLRRRGILYAPDFVINAGGVMLCADEREPGGFSASRLTKRVEGIYDTTRRILDAAAAQDALAGEVALEMARQRIAGAK